MSDLLTIYFEEVERIQRQESEVLTVVLFSLFGAINGDIVDYVRVCEHVELLKGALQRRKDLLAGCVAENKSLLQWEKTVNKLGKKARKRG